MEIPKIKTIEEQIQELKTFITISGRIINWQQALDWLDEDPTIELEFHSFNDVVHSLIIQNISKDPEMSRVPYGQYGWVLPVGKTVKVNVSIE